MGAPDPRVQPPAVKLTGMNDKAKPLGVSAGENPAVPEVKNKGGSRTRSTTSSSPSWKKTAWCLSASPIAETLLRRANYDLIGLPPTPEEFTSFKVTLSPNAFEKVVDRLLASPALWRALGPLLARQRPLRRHHRR